MGDMKAHNLNLKTHSDDFCSPEDQLLPWPPRSPLRPFAPPASCAMEPPPADMALVLSGLRIVGTLVGWLFIVAVWVVVIICAVLCAIVYMGFFVWLGGAIADELAGE